jgi:hypothetical protein
LKPFSDTTPLYLFLAVLYTKYTGAVVQEGRDDDFGICPALQADPSAAFVLPPLRSADLPPPLRGLYKPWTLKSF